jgi:ribonuclease R
MSSFTSTPQSQTLMGSDTGLTIALGLRATVVLTEATPVTGGLVAELVALEGADLPRASGRGGNRRGGMKPARRKVGVAKLKADAVKRKMKRSRAN